MHERQRIRENESDGRVTEHRIYHIQKKIHLQISTFPNTNYRNGFHIISYNNITEFIQRTVNQLWNYKSTLLLVFNFQDQKKVCCATGTGIVKQHIIT